MRPLQKALIAFLVAVASYGFAAPDWVSTGVKSEGNTLTVPCVGTGPDLSTAKQYSLNQCRSLAVEHLKGYSFRTKSIVVEDNESASLHSEVASDLQINGLGPCKTLRESSEGNDDQGYKSYLLCKFDTSKATVSAVSDEIDSDQEENESSLIKNKETVSAIPVYKERNSKPSRIVSGNRHLLLNTVPKAKRVIVLGPRYRAIVITENPQAILLYEGDKELIIHGPKGYLPKHVLLNVSDRVPASESLDALELVLEK